MKIWNNDRGMIAAAIGCAGCEVKYKRDVISSNVASGENFITPGTDIYYYGHIILPYPHHAPNMSTAKVIINDVEVDFRIGLDGKMLFQNIKNTSGKTIGMQFIGIQITKK